ncbi:hypothetical protein VKS41_008263 [Umbelopsis sp. WA50703]
MWMSGKIGKALGLDDSDSDSNSDTDSKKKSKREIPNGANRIVSSAVNISSSSATDQQGPDLKHSEVAAATTNLTITSQAATNTIHQSNTIISLDSDDEIDGDDTIPKNTPVSNKKSADFLPAEVNSNHGITKDTGNISQTSTSKHDQSSLSLLDDFEDLDPDLAQSFLEASPEYSPYETSIEESTPQKISVKFHMRLYPDAASENKSPTPDEAQLRKVLKILVMDREPLELAIQAFACHKHFKLDDLVFVYNNTKLWPIATPAGLGMQAHRDNNIDVYAKDIWAKKLERDEQIKQERLAAQMKADADFSDGEAEDSQEGSGMVQRTENNSGILLKIRGKDGHDTMMKVKPTTTIASIIKHYRKLNNLGDVQVKLMWDDLTLDENEQVQDTDLEDEDMISATW